MSNPCYSTLGNEMRARLLPIARLARLRYDCARIPRMRTSASPILCTQSRAHFCPFPLISYAY